MLGLSGWKTRLCTVVFGLGLYLTISALISTRRLMLAGGGTSGGISGSFEFDSIFSQQQQQNEVHPIPTQAQHYHHPRNLAAAAAAGSVHHITERPPGSHRKRPGRSGYAQINWCISPLGFKAKPGPVVALASFPGSGNTWLRYLIQQATGFLTGSVYKDYALLKNGFPAENVNNGSVLVVKTHEFGSGARKSFEKVILLIRDPFQSLQAEFNRRSGGHTGHASIDRYKRNGGKYWKNFVNSKGAEWEKMNLDWYNSFSSENKLVVFYDQLVSHTLEVMQKVADFLQVPISEKIWPCVMNHKQGIYKRSKKKLGIEVFSSKMRDFLDQKRRFVYQALGRNNTKQHHHI